MLDIVLALAYIEDFNRSIIRMFGTGASVVPVTPVGEKRPREHHGQTRSSLSELQETIERRAQWGFNLRYFDLDAVVVLLLLTYYDCSLFILTAKKAVLRMNSDNITLLTPQIFLECLEEMVFY